MDWRDFDSWLFPYDDQTPAHVCKQIIGLFAWRKGETVLEPFAGVGNLYNALPPHVKKDWCEIDNGRNFWDWTKLVETIITNPPFRDRQGKTNLVVPSLEHSFEVATKRVIFFINHKAVNSVLFPSRLERWAGEGWGLTHFSVWRVKKWWGNYYLLCWEKGKPSLVRWFAK
jgi:hypothetical protein